MDKRTKNIVKTLADYGAGGGDTKGDLEDLLESFVNAQECDHQCMSNCRRHGCDCACGDWHIDE